MVKQYQVIMMIIITFMSADFDLYRIYPWILTDMLSTIIRPLLVYSATELYDPFDTVPVLVKLAVGDDLFPRPLAVSPRQLAYIALSKLSSDPCIKTFIVTVVLESMLIIPLGEIPIFDELFPLPDVNVNVTVVVPT